MSVHVGIGSWTDPDYTGILFPKGLPAERRLAAYAEVFDHVEVNSSYYAVPRREVVANWVKQTPAGFTFHVKLHRAFSQSPAKTARESELVGRLRAALQPLVRAKRLGVLLLVLPPSFAPEKRSLAELDSLIEKMRPHPLAVELRHSGWVGRAQRERTFAFFRERALVWVAVDMPRIRGSTIMPAVDEATHPHLAYLRLHGRNTRWLAAKSAAERHQHDYSPPEIAAIARRVTGLARLAREVHVVANNHARDYAPKAALALQRRLGRARLTGKARA